MSKLIERLIREELCVSLRYLAILIAKGSTWSSAVACWERQVYLGDFSLKSSLIEVMPKCVPTWLKKTRVASPSQALDSAGDISRSQHEPEETGKPGAMPESIPQSVKSCT